MDLETRKYKVIEKVMLLSESQLDLIESALEKDIELDMSLDRALKQIKDGKVTAHSKVRKKYEKWL